MTRLRLRAPAKVNLTLRILERRPTGFHELETLFQAIDLCDELEVRSTAGDGVALEVIGADVGPAADNLVVRAAEAFLAEAGLRAGVEIVLTKRIPAGAGMGGGSSDAGATLRALNRIWPGSVEPDRLRAIAAELGSDVPFFTQPHGLVTGRGRGEQLEPLQALPPAFLVVGLPPVHVATGPAYGSLARARAESEGGVPPALFPGGRSIPDDWAGVAAVAVNDFEPVVTEAYPAVARALAAIHRTEPTFALLSGSGAAVFGAFSDAADATRARQSAEESCPESRFVLATTLAHLPEIEPIGS